MAKTSYKKISNDGDRDKISFFSLLFFQWINSVFKIGSQRALEESDFLPLPEENSSCFVINQLQANWNKERTQSKKEGRRPRLWKSLVKMISVRTIFLLISTSALCFVSRVLQSLLLGYLVTSLMSAEPQNCYVLYGCAVTMGINALIMCLSMHQFDYQSELLGVRFSSALKGLIYLNVSKRPYEHQFTALQ